MAVRSRELELSQRESPVLSFATNWSTAEFKCFVEELAFLVDDMYRNLGDNAWRQAEYIWGRVVELEEGFWPREEVGSITSKKT
jgi:thiaminase